MYICENDYSKDNMDFLKKEGIQIFHYKLAGNKEPFVVLAQDQIADALEKALDPRNHPILVHCNKGKHRVGCLIGILRKYHCWSMASIFDEYRRFAGQKLCIADQEVKLRLIKYIEQFKLDPKRFQSLF
jgi:tyrosine-protein phosphatase SIW14